VGLRELLLRIVRKTLRDGYLSDELEELIERTVEDIRRRKENVTE
jgi:hypothetical protein